MHDKTVVQRSLFPLLFLSCFALLTGCSGSACSVSGEVTVNDQPLVEGFILFRPETDEGEMKPVQSKISDGKFSISSSDGLLPGVYLVQITANRKTGRKYPAEEGGAEMIDEIMQYIPSKFNVQTTLEEDISSNRDDLKFDLAI